MKRSKGKNNFDKDLSVNGSGCYDPTAYKAIKNVDNDEDDGARFYMLLDTIFNICELSGFHLEGRIEVKDKKTGRIWR